MVLSHQGKLEFASPVIPKTLEAIVLYHADELSAKTNAYKGAILNESGNDKRLDTIFTFSRNIFVYSKIDFQKMNLKKLYSSKFRSRNGI